MDYIDKRLAHLTMEQIDRLMLDYYMGKRVSDLIEEYNIDILPQMLYKNFPPIINENELCPYCNVPIIITRSSRTSFSESRKYCYNCGHEQHKHCKCNNCNKEKERIIEIKLQNIREAYNIDNYCPVKLDDLTFRGRVYLAALLRIALSEDMKYIVPYEKVQDRLSPISEYDRIILDYLLGRNIIRVDPTSDIEAFPDEDEDDFPTTFYPFRVKYIVNVDFTSTYEEGIESLMNPTETIPYNKEEAKKIWKEIAVMECVNYLKYQIRSVGFNFNGGKKTLSVLSDMLEKFSVSQVYGIIYRCVANATKYHQEKGIRRNEATNFIITGCQRYAERAILSNWDLTRYRRHEPETIVSEVFFNRIIQIGSLGFDMCHTDL